MLANCERELIDELTGDFYQAVFHALDERPEFTGLQAGRVATAVEQAAKTALAKLLNDKTGQLGGCFLPRCAQPESDSRLQAEISGERRHWLNEQTADA